MLNVSGSFQNTPKSISFLPSFTCSNPFLISLFSQIFGIGSNTPGKPLPASRRKRPDLGGIFGVTELFFQRQRQRFIQENNKYNTLLPASRSYCRRLGGKSGVTEKILTILLIISTNFPKQIVGYGKKCLKMTLFF